MLLTLILTLSHFLTVSLFLTLTLNLSLNHSWHAEQLLFSSLCSKVTLTLSLTGHAKDDSGSDQAKPAGQCKKPPPGGGTCIPRVAAMLAHFLETLGELLSAVVKDNDMKAGQTNIMDSDAIKSDAD